MPMTNNLPEGVIHIQDLGLLLDDTAIQEISDAISACLDREDRKLDSQAEAYIQSVLDGCAFPDCDCAGVGYGEDEPSHDEALSEIIIADGGYTAILADGTELNLDERAQVSYNDFGTPTVTLTLATDAVTFL